MMMMIMNLKREHFWQDKKDFWCGDFDLDGANCIENFNR